MKVKKHTQDVKSSMLKHRGKASAERAASFDGSQQINPDKVNDNFKGLYSKGMSHNATTMVSDETLIKELELAMLSGNQADFDDLTKGGVRKQVSPQGALAFENMGQDPCGVTISAPPALASREGASEMLEVFEAALLKDKTFDYIEGSTPDSDIDRAIATLNAFGSDFKGPKESGVVTRKSLFRGFAPGELIGPYVSQFLYLDVPFGAHKIVQKYDYEQGVYGITKSNFLAIQNGTIPVAQQAHLADRKYCNTPRSLGSIVHTDFVYQQFLYAAVILLSKGVARRSGWPTLVNEDRFVTNAGGPDVGCAVAEVARHALKAAWCQKWVHHIKLRPEAFAGRLVAQMDGDLPVGTVHPDMLTLGSNTIDAVKSFNASNGGESKAFLPLQFAEGSPLHPAYPAGHAAIAGACVTVLKFFFNTSLPWVATMGSVKHSIDGDSLVDYSGSVAGLTIDHELNKLASNISIGRNIAGVHYRSDGDQGMILGEKIAIEYMKDLKSQQNEEIGDLTIVKFDGTTVTI